MHGDRVAFPFPFPAISSRDDGSDWMVDRDSACLRIQTPLKLPRRESEACLSNPSGLKVAPVTFQVCMGHIVAACASKDIAIKPFSNYRESCKAGRLML